MKKLALIYFIAGSVIIGNFLSCTKDDFTNLTTEIEDDTDIQDDDDMTTTELAEDHENDADYIWDSSDIVEIMLQGNSISVNGDGATVDGTQVTIHTAGNYQITGTLNDGQVIVDTEDEETVRLLLNGVDITNTTNAPINIVSSEKTIIVLVANTTNYLTDSDAYVFENAEEEPNAALFSADDLTIFGEGILMVKANYNNGITSKDGLIIKSSTIHVDAEDDGIRGKDYLIVKGGNTVVNAEGDGLVANNDEDSGKGYIAVEAGVIDITAQGDGLFAETTVAITYGEMTIESGGGNNSNLSGNASAKGIKANVDIIIEAGILNINSADDNIHATNNIRIKGGTFVLATGDDAIHSDATIVIDDGDINITSAVEGLESPNITINDGFFDIVTSDDAINAVGSSLGNYLYINGGYLAIDCSGDGLDTNGNIEMNGGTVIINGPTAQNNSPIDYDGKFDLNGGFLVGTGYASNMDEAGSASSDQNSLLIKLNAVKTAGSLIHIENSSGGDILTFSPSKEYKSIVFSSPELSSGSNYNVYFGGSSTGTVTDGVYEGGTYTSGSLYSSFTISGAVTSVN